MKATGTVSPAARQLFHCVSAMIAVAVLSGFIALALLSASAAAKDSATVQRVDGCIVMDVRLAQIDGERHVWNFQVERPGTYLAQVITAIEDAPVVQSARVRVDEKQISDAMEQAHLIEDGLISESSHPFTLTAPGNHTLTIDSAVPLRQARLVPQAYSKSRIHISSSRYYKEWVAMHQSGEKQAALQWFKKARFGMFIHWGVYSEAAGSWKGTRIEQANGPRVAEWLMFAFQISREDYREFAKTFHPDKSFAVNIARLAKETGMKYVVVTAKHHDGFALFDSAHSSFDIADATSYQGDLIKELYDACRAEGLEFGVYYSHGNDWSEGSDGNFANVKKRNDAIGLSTRHQGKNLWDPSPNTHAEYLKSKAYPQVAELIKMLPDLRLIWFDGEGLITEQQAFRFYRMVYELNPNIIVNRRVGYDFGDYVDAGDNKTPDAEELSGKHFETCGTGNHSWGFKAHDDNWKSPYLLLRNFVDIVSKGGNYLLNIGPDGQGNVPEPCVKNFRKMGRWVNANADAIFGTTTWTTFHEGGREEIRAEEKRAVSEASPKEFWFGARDDKVYVMSLAPTASTVRVCSLKRSAGTVTQVRVLGSDADLNWTQTDDVLEFDLRGVKTDTLGYVAEVTMKQEASTKGSRDAN